MSRRSEVRHEVRVLRLGPAPAALPEGPVVVLFCARGRVGVPALGEVLAPGELLRLDFEAGLAAVGLAPDTAALAVVLHPLRAGRR